ncbi:hypothetical protein IV203_035464 [Nitzschia inconspicua]|uniref:Uncharacterized protein n=1 Tax=Nitzschia inconspicua TaxID=303405 RepID=A0A9K3LDC5_9STRA|nr:hypothetical protein IV203_035464 [Nitzschia inconspicua]
MTGISFLTILVSLEIVHSFSSLSSPIRRVWKHVSRLRQTSSDGDNMSTWEQNVRDLRRIQEQQIQKAVMEELFLSKESASEMMPITLIGQTKLPLVGSGNRTVSAATSTTMVVLASSSTTTTTSKSRDQRVALLVPLTSPESQLKLLSFAYAKEPLSSLTLLLSLNTLLVNRDNALFDNVPWSTWSVDPQRRNRDAAGNPIESKFHLGKRDAYNRFMGKDWPGRSLALGNMAMRLSYLMGESAKTESAGLDEDESLADSSTNQLGLAKRILELRIRELQMELAELDSQLAIARNNPDEFSDEDVKALQGSKRDLEQNLQDAKNDLNLLLQENVKSTKKERNAIPDRIAKWAAEDGNGRKSNQAPYRGAMGYDPMIDSYKEIEKTFLERSYRSPFDLVLEILDDQLNAKVIGCALENISLLRGNLVLGGAIVIQRKVANKRTLLAGEEVEYEDTEETFGNEGVAGREIFVVECDVDEAIGVSLASDIPLQIERSIFEQATSIVEIFEEVENNTGSTKGMKGVLPLCKVTESSVSVQVEGEGSSSERVAPISIPRTTAPLYDPFSDNRQSSVDEVPKQLFPTDNPIKSLEQLDGLDNAAKAKTLLEMSNFRGSLPRPRVVRNAPPNENPLDQLLLPLIDESVRKQYRLRKAEETGDKELVEQLKAEKSQLQIAREKADIARLEGNDDAAKRWEEEAQFLETLRADVTQDVGSYSRFLDRDEWYERDRQRTAKRTKKSSFGNLLDGLE